MKFEPIPVTPALISWARIRAGYSIDDARKIYPAIEDWEDDKSSPSYPQLESMSDKFKVPVAVFFFPEPPDIPPVSQSFRTLPENELEQLPRRIKYLLRKAKAYQLSLAEIADNENPASRLITRDMTFTLNVSIQAMALAVRQYLGASVEDQTKWPDVETALENWRHRLWDVGVYVFKEAFRIKSYSGFCLYDSAFPIIYVNNSSAKTRQIFTLFHELAHLLFHTSGIDALKDNVIDRLPGDSRELEILCNRFAAEFLLPDTVFEETVRGMDPSETTAENLADRYHVSREVVYRKFRDRQLISKEQYESAAKKWAEQKQEGSGGNYYYTTISYLGKEYINLALGQYYRNRIDDVQLAEYLGVKPRYLSTLEEYVLRGA